MLTPDSRCTEIPPISPPVPRRPAGTERVEQFAELVAAEGIPIAMSRADRRAVAACELPPAVVANAVVDVVRGKWGNAWLRENLSVSVVVKKLTAYLNRTQAAARPSPVASSAYSHDPWQGTAPPIDPADLAAFYGAAS